MKRNSTIQKQTTFFVMLVLGVSLSFITTVAGQSYSGIYKNVWHYKNDALETTSYQKILFLNDSTCLFINSDRPDDLQFNSTGPNIARYIGRKIVYKGQPRWFIVRDDANIGYRIAASTFTDTSGRLDFYQAVNYNWALDPNSKIPEPSKNPYEIYELQFFKDSFYVSAIRTFQPDNGDLGMHYKIKSIAYNHSNTQRLPKMDPRQVIQKNCTLTTSDMQHFCTNCFFPATVKSDVDGRYIPISENIAGNTMEARFKTGESVLVQKGTYMNYAFIVTTDNQNHIKKYGWILRSQLTPKEAILH
ncbi:hypothetical protein GCM10027566_24300 [Arachidicoccus ginsenosidivorans]|uniref:DUF1800 domain-containing protein n=1 Tax=Arachidicoccus ginsenosidivorans TaxID=496057 RepID=A0A5B8VSB5_9BACT|nr:DUF1800 domain-containing protein [Arachidicoccus ginsenosidivorans]QEC73465.1 DUF1800 domain-containing protein [Arachidicoccus ginsenosidivorans]